MFMRNFLSGKIWSFTTDITPIFSIYETSISFRISWAQFSQTFSGVLIWCGIVSNSILQHSTIDKIMWSFANIYQDFSNFSKDSKIFNETNKWVIGKMKDEFGGVIVEEFVGLKSKMYSMKKLMIKNIIQQKE